MVSVRSDGILHRKFPVSEFIDAPHTAATLVIFGIFLLKKVKSRTC